MQFTRPCFERFIRANNTSPPPYPHIQPKWGKQTLRRPIHPFCHSLVAYKSFNPSRDVRKNAPTTVFASERISRNHLLGDRTHIFVPVHRSFDNLQTSCCCSFPWSSCMPGRLPRKRVCHPHLSWPNTRLIAIAPIWSRASSQGRGKISHNHSAARPPEIGAIVGPKSSQNLIVYLQFWDRRNCSDSPMHER
jgi:hypothetical protein